LKKSLAYINAPATSSAVAKSKQAAIVLTLAALTLAPALCQEPPRSGKKYDIEFTNMVDSTKGFAAFESFPAINNHGDVAFTANQNGVGPGVFRVREPLEQVTAIASALDGLTFFADSVAVNSSGVVAFAATTSTNSLAIFKGDGKSRTLIADSTVNGLVKLGLGAPSINAAGTVAFSALLAQHGSPGAVFTGTGGPLRTVASTDGGSFTSFENVAINDAGTVVFPANLKDGTIGVFTFSDALAGIVDTKSHPEIDFFGDPVINNSGTIADDTGLLPFDAPEIFTATARGFTPRNNPANPSFKALEHPSLNNRNAIAFSAIPSFLGDTSPTGIFLEVSGGQSLIPVVRPGDKLFGSTVDHVDLGRFALNDRFQMAFSYTLTDGRSGIAIASFNGEKEGEDQSR
jgi:hypothetical protein